MQNIQTPKGNLSTILLYTISDVCKAIDFIKTKNPGWVKWLAMLTKIKDSLMLLRSYQVNAELQLQQMEYIIGENEMLKRMIGALRLELDNYQATQEMVYLTNKEVEEIMLNHAATVYIEQIENPKDKIKALAELVKQRHQERKDKAHRHAKMLLAGKRQQVEQEIKEGKAA